MTPKTTVWLYGIMKKWKTHFNYFFMLKFCKYLSFDWCFALMPHTMHRYCQNFGNIKSFSGIEILVYLRFLHCVPIWDEFPWLCGQLCMVTLSTEWRLNHMQIWLSADWGIFVKMKWFRSRASEPCSLLLKVQHSMCMRWLPMVARTCTCANSLCVIIWSIM